MLSDIKMSVIILNIVMMNVVAPSSASLVVPTGRTLSLNTLAYSDMS
jgi:hypothetical protein